MIRNCDYCGTPYEGKRKSSRFCCAACRVNFNLLPGKLSAYAESAENVLLRMTELVDRYPQHLATQFIELLERHYNKTRAHARAVADRHPIQRKLSAPPPPAPAKRKAPAAPAASHEKRSSTGSAPAPRVGKTHTYEATFKYQKQGDDRVLTGKLRRKSELFGDALEVVIETEISKVVRAAGHRWNYEYEIVEISPDKL